MPLLVRSNTPAFLPDFDSISGPTQDLAPSLSAWFVQNMKDHQFGADTLHCYDAANFDPGGIAVEQEITWNAFAKELLCRHERHRALVFADRLWPIQSFGGYPPDILKACAGNRRLPRRLRHL